MYTREVAAVASTRSVLTSHRGGRAARRRRAEAHHGSKLHTVFVGGGQVAPLRVGREGEKKRVAMAKEKRVWAAETSAPAGRGAKGALIATVPVTAAGDWPAAL